ncbi:MAG: divalent-cation tolerance protein CutA [Bdellovibrionaceae bacterium]|jgi:periplasmic divalent cation tolerance protein|nr:divalent-cation tolerance protein CutA [Pseudobdellovibrionaceae bacterium]
MKLIFIYSTFPSKKIAQKVANQLIKEKLIACANITEQGLSVYEWKGKVNTDNECYAIFKTSLAKHKKAIKRLQAIHPYETPALLCWTVDSLNHTYSAWVKRSVTD